MDEVVHHLLVGSRGVGVEFLRRGAEPCPAQQVRHERSMLVLVYGRRRGRRGDRTRAPFLDLDCCHTLLLSLPCWPCEPLCLWGRIPPEPRRCKRWGGAPSPG